MSKGQHVGYIRVGPIDHNSEHQLEGLELDKVFQDTVGGRERERPQLKACLEYVQAGDTLHVQSIDRMGRSLQDLKNIVSDMMAKGVTTIFHKEQITFDHTNHGSASQHIFHALAAFAEFERNLIRERQMEGIAQAKADGKHFGRLPKLSEKEQAEVVRRYNEFESISSLAKSFNVSRGTIYNVLEKLGQRCNSLWDTGS